MKTGEGKTLVATFPAYLNALTGKGVHIVTVNDYLVRRDAEWMGKVYGALGLTTGAVYPQQPEAEKRAAYQADITYATNNELGFDYLRDNMKSELSEMHAARPQLRHRRRGRFDPDRRGADAADHLGPLDRQVRAVPHGRRADPGADRRALQDRRKAARQATFTEEGNEFLEQQLARTRHPAARADAVRPGIDHARPPRQPGAAGAQAVPEGQGIHRPQRRGDADRRIHRPDDDGPAAVGRAASGDRGQGRRRDPARERDAGLGDLPELLPPLRQAGRHDRHRGDRGRGIPRDLQAGRGRGADQPADRPQRRTRPRLSHRAREIRSHRRSRSRTAMPRASRSWSAPPRSRSRNSCRSCCRRPACRTTC